ncbi:MULTISPECIES: hypothetical protein [Pseudomonadaceae]|jgi:hypothetical protein|uniref:Uncharacterized protein n=1 Tax=Ectopseudomonas hydrolytica TaxID=2493633 RepID=A0ABY5A9W9_9GAMM|nr:MULTISPECIES: hypothetical protein [Pseudomonas]ARS46976.1 hypothetical protein PSMEN_00730 [Pseudomonas mendocina]EJO94722.1 hypothetical protein A471_06486 [Pseudomonas mendocina DLHK]ATH79772.1 hypothetical protein CO724_00850 [Pseudomonas mendocina]MBA4244732.1 hypothetical protein [Pseudomonas sp.]MBF8160353.1 hypothetical protein [Pseudomonas mendocina]
MYLVRLSLFCVATLLVNGAYANDFIGSAGASARTADLTVSNAQSRESASAEQRELSQSSGSRRAQDDAQWLRISDETDTANREPRPAVSTPRWVF